ncbi:MAG: hypothetical protein AAF495_02415 [Pseudomonadota bacterium]
MTKTASSQGATIELKGPFAARDLRALRSAGPIDCLSLTKHPLITAKLATALSGIPSLRWLHLWCETTRTAMGRIIAIPGMEELDVLQLRKPGTLGNFAHAGGLKRFQCAFMSEEDFLEISRSPNLVRLMAQNGTLSIRALDAVLELPKLRELDLEEANLDDEMAAALASSSTVETLDIAATRVTAKGLRSICAMSQLRALDIWALDIVDEDLDLLTGLPNLEYLSIGGHEHHPTLKAKGVLPRLAALPSLKRIWLDGIPLSRSEEAALKRRYDDVRTSSATS